MNREEAEKRLEEDFEYCGDCNSGTQVNLREASDIIDELFDQHEAQLKEIEGRSCEGCKYVYDIDMGDTTCNHEEMANYYGMQFDVETFSCSNWEKK